MMTFVLFILRGASAVVYKARDAALNRTYALKVIQNINQVLPFLSSVINVGASGGCSESFELFIVFQEDPLIPVRF